LIALHEELEIPIQAIFRLEDLKKDASEKGTKINANWQLLKSRAEASELHWKNTIIKSLSPADYKEIRELYDLLATDLYRIHELRKIYLKFYEFDKFISTHTFNEASVDLRHYKYLYGLIRNCEYQCEELIFALLMEHLYNLPEFSAENGSVYDPNSLGYNDLKMLFDEELKRLTLDQIARVKSKSFIEQQKYKLVQFHDKMALVLTSVKRLEHINLNPAKMLTGFQNRSVVSRYVHFVKGLSDQIRLSKEEILAQSMSLKTEFCSKMKMIDSRIIENGIAKLEFLSSLRDVFEPSQFHDFNHYQWSSDLSKTSMLQLMQEMKLIYPVVKYHFSNFLGQLLLSLRSPGPVGCIEHHQCESIKVFQF
jgi:hypothetical protein